MGEREIPRENEKENAQEQAQQDQEKPPEGVKEEARHEEVKEETEKKEQQSLAEEIQDKPGDKKGPIPVSDQIAFVIAAVILIWVAILGLDMIIGAFVLIIPLLVAAYAKWKKLYIPLAIVLVLSPPVVLFFVGTVQYWTGHGHLSYSGLQAWNHITSTRNCAVPCMWAGVLCLAMNGCSKVR